MSMKNDQEAFNIMVTHLRTQACTSMSAGGACAYRGQDGSKCAVGILISDEHYSVGLENQGPRSAAVAEAIGNSGWSSLSYDMLDEMQSVHDSADTCDWELHFERIARVADLRMPV